MRSSREGARADDRHRVPHRARASPSSAASRCSRPRSPRSCASRARAREDLRVDISTRPEDTLLGDDWYRWLAQLPVHDRRRRWRERARPRRLGAGLHRARPARAAGRDLRGARGEPASPGGTASSPCTRSPLATWRRAPRARRRSSSRATTMACSSGAGTTCPCAGLLQPRRAARRRRGRSGSRALGRRPRTGTSWPPAAGPIGDWSRTWRAGTSSGRGRNARRRAASWHGATRSQRNQTALAAGYARDHAAAPPAIWRRLRLRGYGRRTDVWQ